MSQHSGDLQIATSQVIQPQTVRDIDFLTCIAALSSASPAFAPFEAVLRARLFAAFCSDAQTLHAARTPRLPLSQTFLDGRDGGPLLLANMSQIAVKPAFFAGPDGYP